MNDSRSASLQLTPEVSCLGSGRRFIAQTLHAWQVDEAFIESVLLVANELMTNAIVHAHSAPTLSLEEAGTDLYIRVTDASRQLPAPKAGLSEDAHGLGMVLVDKLSDQWGCEATASGKTVWVAFAGAFA